MVKHRERIVTYIPIEMAKWLKEKSEETGAPVSRLVERIIEQHIKKEAPPK